MGRNSAEGRGVQLGMNRFVLLVLIALFASACGGTAPASSTRTSSPGQSTAPAPEAPSPNPVEGLGSALEAAGAAVREIGTFPTEPLTGQGVLLCVEGQEVRVYAYATEEERAAVADQIDPTDPSNVGTSMVSWAGMPRFWQAERIIVLYLGDNPAIESGLTSVLGEPFARGPGRDPGLARHNC